MIETKLKRGDVVQISPDVPNAAVKGCYITVTGMAEHDGKDCIEGYITSPGHSDSIRIQITIPDYDHVEYVGTSKFVHEQEWVSV